MKSLDVCIATKNALYEYKQKKVIYLMSEQPQLFETEDQYGNDIIQDLNLLKRN